MMKCPDGIINEAFQRKSRKDGAALLRSPKRYEVCFRGVDFWRKDGEGVDVIDNDRAAEVWMMLGVIG